MGSRILALVSDCYGARGGIARYNQDLFEALADGSTEILILPRHGDASGMVLPAGVRQNRSIFGRLGFSLAASTSLDQAATSTASGPRFTNSSPANPRSPKRRPFGKRTVPRHKNRSKPVPPTFTNSRKLHDLIKLAVDLFFGHTQYGAV